MDVHVDRDLSAYLDGELAPEDRARVDAHLDGCDRCRARLSELRATASLLAALPSPRPRRSLVPPVAGRMNWLRPMRSLSALASGMFLFAFLVTAIGRSGSGLGGGSPTSIIQAPEYRDAAPAAAPAATAAPTAAFGPAQIPAPQPSPKVAADSARSSGEAAATARVEIAPATAGSPEAFAASAPREGLREASPLLEPLLWLGLAVIAAVGAFAAHWRLRTS